MHEFSYLKDILIILSCAIVVLVIFNRLKLPAITGFILTGVLLGPDALALINNSNNVEVLAEIGIALLLFGIGVELSINKLRRLWRLIITGGVLQVGLSSLAGFGLSLYSGLTISQSIFIGIVIALSSTAVVLRLLQQRGELDAPHGQLILGILIFQDFSVIPAMLLIPFLLGGETAAGSIAVLLLKSIVIITGVLLLAIFVVPRILNMVAKTRERQLFILTVFVISIGTAWLVTTSGASLAIGAFLAGLVVSGSEYRHQALAEMIPFREVFAGLFFVTIGMLLSPSLIAANAGSIILLLTLIMVGKAIIVFITASFIRMPVRAAFLSALALAQIGEFSFILLYSVKGTGLISMALENMLISAAILSMFLTPLIMSLGPRFAAGMGKFKAFSRLIEVPSAAEAPPSLCKLCDHIIIAGYGFAGRELALTLRTCQIPFIVVDLNSANIRKAAEETGSAVFGDITSEGVLDKLGIREARELVILINDPSASELAVRVARNLVPKLYITVRTQYLLDVISLQKAGANEVIASEREAAVQVSSQILKRNDIDAHELARRKLEIRSHSENNQA